MRSTIAVEHVVDALRRVASLRLKSRSAFDDLERVLGALRLVALGLVEARVLERDRGVAAEHLEQADVVFVELASTPSLEMTTAPLTRVP